MPPKTEFARHSFGILFYLAGVFCFAANDALAKFMVSHYSVAEILVIRSVGGLAMLLPVAWYFGVALKLHGHWGWHLFRVLAQLGDSYCFYLATRTMPLADVMTFYMAGPIIVTAISGLLMGEKVGPYRWSAVIVGFIGVVIALAPTSATFSSGSLIALAGSFMFAISLVITRKQRDTHPLTLVASQFFSSGLIAALVAPLAWVTPGLGDLSLLLLLGVGAAACFLMITRALAMAPASLLAPFQYSAILWAAMFGWIIWHDVMTPRIILGNAILIGSGLFVFYRERRLSVSVSDEVEQIP
jgi:S-adenosylmethionine uptake transporter